MKNTKADLNDRVTMHIRLEPDYLQRLRALHLLRVPRP